MAGKVNLADVIKDRAMHEGRPKVSLGKKRKLFKPAFNLKRGT